MGVYTGMGVITGEYGIVLCVQLSDSGNQLFELGVQLSDSGIQLSDSGIQLSNVLS